MAALAAIKRALQKGDLGTRPEEDAAQIAAAAGRHAVPASELAAAAAEIRDWSRRPVGELALTVWLVLGDPGADVLELAIRLMARE
jgi:hypothetical protein